MKKLLLLLGVGVLLLAVTGVLAATEGAQRVKHFIGGSLSEPIVSSLDENPAPSDPKAGTVPDSAPLRPAFEIKPYDPKAKDAALYARARSLVQITQLLGETKEKLMTPLRKQLEREGQEATAAP
jgi:hypothetical protein